MKGVHEKESSIYSRRKKGGDGGNGGTGRAGGQLRPEKEKTEPEKVAPSLSLRKKENGGGKGLEVCSPGKRTKKRR